MDCVKKLKAALAAVPVSQPCTAAAVAALSVGAHDAAERLVPWLSQTPATDGSFSDVAEACASQQLPAACMPVLAWLADGLRSGLPAATQQQALNVASVLLGVVSVTVPDSEKGRVWNGAMYTPEVLAAEADARRLLQTLGPLEEVCRQLATMASALMDTVFPAGGFTTTTTTTTTSTSSSSSRPAAEPQQVASMALAWHCTVRLLETMLVAQDEALVGQALAAALRGSGVFQVLLEGSLLLLGVDPAAYSQAPDIQLVLSGSLGVAVRAANSLTQNLAPTVASAWYTAHTPGNTPGVLLQGGCVAHPPSSSSSAEPWMAPLFKLQVLMLAKLQWDVRQLRRPPPQPRHLAAWPAKPLARAVRHMVSPCVAGDLLQQRAPGLVPHVCKTRALVVKQRGQLAGRKEAERAFDTMQARLFSEFLVTVGRSMRAFLKDGVPFAAMGALDLALLLEATELQCLVPPTPDGVRKDAMLALQQTVEAAPRSVRAEFAATSGEALLSIAEHLVEDVLLVSSGAAGAASGSAAGPPAASRGAAAVAAAGTDNQPSSNSNSNSSSSSKRRYLVGGGSPEVTLMHRVRWAQDSVTNVGVLMRRQRMDWAAPSETGGPPELGGQVAGVMHSLFTPTNTPRLSRLFEVALRAPELQGTRLHNLTSLLPRRLPLLHVAASSPEGCRSLLSAVTSAAKRQQVGIAVMSALVQAQGELAPAAARVAAAVPGRMGQAVAQQLLQQPDMAVNQAVERGIDLAELAIDLMARAAALLDPVVAPLAAHLATTQLPPGQDSKPWAVEAVLSSTEGLLGSPGRGFDYRGLLAGDPQHMPGIMRDLTAALSLQQAAAVSKQAAKLVKAAGGGAEEAEQLRQQLQCMWLGDVPAGSSTIQQQQVAAGGAQGPANSALATAAGSGSSTGATASDADLRVASTALLAACKAAGAAAQLPLLVVQVQHITVQQPWGQAGARHPRIGQALGACRRAADWALLLAPLLAVLLPAQQAAEVQEAAAEAQRDDVTSKALLTPATSARVLGLLGHVVVPGAPGCSYPGCCNLEGRSEAELRVQVCSKCKGVRYCCREHQLAHWKAGHKEVCRAAQAAVEQVRQSTAPAGP